MNALLCVEVFFSFAFFSMRAHAVGLMVMMKQQCLSWVGGSPHMLFLACRKGSSPWCALFPPPEIIQEKTRKNARGGARQGGVRGGGRAATVVRGGGGTVVRGRGGFVARCVNP